MADPPGTARAEVAPAGQWEAEVARAMDEVRTASVTPAPREWPEWLRHVAPVAAAVACLAAWTWSVHQIRSPVAPLPAAQQQADLKAAAAFASLFVEQHRGSTGRLPSDLDPVGLPPLFTYVVSGPFYILGAEAGGASARFDSGQDDAASIMDARAQEWRR